MLECWSILLLSPRSPLLSSPSLPAKHAQKQILFLTRLRKHTHRLVFNLLCNLIEEKNEKKKVDRTPMPTANPTPTRCWYLDRTILLYLPTIHYHRLLSSPPSLPSPSLPLSFLFRLVWFGTSSITREFPSIFCILVQLHCTG